MVKIQFPLLMFPRRRQVSSVEETVSVESAESKAADKFDEIVDAFSDALEGRTLDKTASCDWNGKFVCADTGAQMTLGQIDNNSFEFTISNGEYELTEKVARVYGNLAVYEQPQTEDETFSFGILYGRRQDLCCALTA